MDQVSVSPLAPVPTAQVLNRVGSKAPFRKGDREDTPAQDLKDMLFSAPWMKWFVDLREKINVINTALVAMSAASGDGIVVVDETSGTAQTRSIVGTAGEINVANGDGLAGNPTISIIATGITPGSYHGFTVDADGRITAVNVTYTVAGLPAGALGHTAFVTDSTVGIAAGLGLAPVGGGAFGVPVFHDGVSWLIG